MQLSPWYSVSFGEKELSNIECGEELLEILSGCEDTFLLGMLTRQQVKAMEEARMEKHEEIRKKITVEVNLRVGGNKLSEGTLVLKTMEESFPAW